MKSAIEGFIRVGLVVGAVGVYSGCDRGVALKTITTDLTEPVLVTAVPGDADALAAVERRGLIKAISVSDGGSSVAMDIGDRVDAFGNRGAMGFAFDPDFGTNGYFYVLYNHSPTVGKAESTNIRISRFTAAAGEPFIGDPNSEHVLLEFNGYTGEHNGGSLQFGPADGYLYIFVGDAMCCNDPMSLAQDLSAYNGKILRIDVTDQKAGDLYDVPPDNPFVEMVGARPEIWAYGVRNPFRASFDRETGDLYFADVGEKAFEEINYQSVFSTGGENYGWPVFEGNACNPNAVPEEACDVLRPTATFPIVALAYGTANSVTGGVVYRGDAMPRLRGTYFFGDWAKNRLWSVRIENGAVSPLNDWTEQVDPDGSLLRQLVAFGEGADGAVYALTYTGNVYQLVPAE